MITQRRRHRSSASSRSPRGARCSPTRSTPASTCSSPRCSTSSPRARSSTSPATCSPRCSKRGKPLLGSRRRRATGRTSARSRRTCARTRTSSTGRCDVDIDGFRLGEGVWLGEGADVDPDARIEGPASSATTAASRPARTLRAYTVLGTDVVVKARRVPRARRRATTTCTSATRRGCAAASSGAPATSARTPRVEEGVVVGDECFVGERRGHQPGREDLPVQDGRGRRGRHLVDRVGEPRRAHAVRPARRRAGSPTSTSRPRSRSASRWPTAPR